MFEPVPRGLIESESNQASVFRMRTARSRKVFHGESSISCSIERARLYIFTRPREIIPYCGFSYAGERANCCSTTCKNRRYAVIPIHGGPIIARKHERLVFASGKLDRVSLAGILRCYL